MSSTEIENTEGGENRFAARQATLEKTVKDFVIEREVVVRINKIFSGIKEPFLKSHERFDQRFFNNHELLSQRIMRQLELPENKDAAFNQLLEKVIQNIVEIRLQYLLLLRNSYLKKKLRAKNAADEIALLKELGVATDSVGASFDKPTQKRSSKKYSIKLAKLDLENHDHVDNIIAAVRLTIELIRPGDRNNTGQLQGLLFGDNGAVTAGRIENFLNNKIENSPHLTRKNIIQILDILGVLSEDKTPSTVNRRYKSKSPQYRFQAERAQQIKDAEITAAIGQLLQNEGFSKEE